MQLSSNLPIVARKRSQLFLAAVFLAVAGLLPIRSQGQETVPSASDVALGVATAQSRDEVLLTVIAVARYLSISQNTVGESFSHRIREDMDWLRRLRDRSGSFQGSSPVLDPAAWLIQLELERRDLDFSALVSPLGPNLEIYLDQVFDRSQERLAQVVLAELIWRSEPLSTVIWTRFEEQLQSDEELKAAAGELFSDRPDVWPVPAKEPPPNFADELFEQVSDEMNAIVREAISSGPPDLERLRRVRFSLLTAMPELAPAERQEAIAFFRLSGLLDGLHERRYFAFASGLLAVVAEMVNIADPDSAQDSLAANWLVNNLPQVSARFAKAFAIVDPRLNSAMAAVFDVVKEVSRSSQASLDTISLRSELADAVAQLALLIPDLDFYYNLPVRDSIAGGMDACTGMVARREEDGSPAMTRELFDDCQQSIVDLADNESRAAALSGDPNGPFGSDQLTRELTVTSGQRINYGVGYLHDRYATGCGEPARPLPNPLEWSTLSTLLAWLAEQSPVYFQTPENESRLQRMRGIGQELLRVVAEQVDCFAGSGGVVNDPVSRSLADYRAALVTLSSGINGAVFDYRARTLAPGADIALQRDADQPTAYRPDDLMIGPCDPENVCEMKGTLTSTRALLGLFPDNYLVADQTGLGQVEICYQDMAWVNRRAEQIRADDTNVSNYFGQLEFKLLGRYRAGETVDDIFGFLFTSPNEHHYLFAAATQEVLDDSCPVEWIGQRIVTPLKSDRGGIVPNRLTYLAAPRMLPSRLLSNNWDRGAEWRDWFITGIGVRRLELPPAPDINSPVNQHLQMLHRAEQAAIYQSALRPAMQLENSEIESLFEETNQLSTIKLLIRQQIMLFYPQLLNESDELRSSVAGQGGLLDSGTLARFRADNVPVDALNSIAFERLERVENDWQRQPESMRRTGSIASSLAHAMMRLNALYRTFFAEASQPVISDTPEPEVVTSSEADPVD